MTWYISYAGQVVRRTLLFLGCLLGLFTQAGNVCRPGACVHEHGGSDAAGGRTERPSFLRRWSSVRSPAAGSHVATPPHVRLVMPVSPRRASAIASSSRRSRRVGHLLSCPCRPVERHRTNRDAAAGARNTSHGAHPLARPRQHPKVEGRRVPVVFSERARCRVNAIQLVRVSARFRAPRRLPQHCRSETRGKKNKQGW